jgi:putative FmdB family regulatory protein
MPLYEYQCDACGDRFEKIQKYSDPLVDVCPKCGGTVKKLLSSPAIQFKGSGFYITDYARKSSTENSSRSSSEKSEKSDKSDKSDKSGNSGDTSSGSGSGSSSSSATSTTSTTPSTTSSKE